MKKEPTSNFRCVGGPLDKKVLNLSVNHPYTLTFNLKGWKGRYLNSRDGAPKLMWEPA